MIKNFKIMMVKLYHNEAAKFIVLFLSVFLILNYTNKFFNSMGMVDSRFHNQFFSDHLNYVQGLRTLLIEISATILKAFGFIVLHTKYQLLILNGLPCNINYSCLGLGVMSFWVAFTIAFPKPFKEKIKFLFIGLISIFILNITRIVSITILTVNNHGNKKFLDYQHDIFNYVVYAVLLGMIYFWIKNHQHKPTLATDI
jgi:exosortase/archaeosortase family protein